jgi:hypothetical protein
MLSDWDGNLMTYVLCYRNFGEVFCQANGNAALMQNEITTKSLMIVTQDGLTLIGMGKMTVEQKPSEAS